MPLVMSTEWRRELDFPLAPGRFSRVDMERDSGGVLVKTLATRAAASLERTFSPLSEEEPFEESFSSLSPDGFFLALGSFSLGFEDDFFASLTGVAVFHIPQDEPSRLIFGRSFFRDLISGGGGGASGTAGGGGGRPEGE